MRGRKPKPTAQKIAEGNRGKRRLNADEPKPSPGAPDAPPHLAGHALARWNELVPELDRVGMLSKVDLVALATYCDAWALYLRCRMEIAAGGACYVNDRGNLVQSPWVRLADKQSELLHRLGAEFGLSPSSRARVKVTVAGAADDELSDFLDAPSLKIAN